MAPGQTSYRWRARRRKRLTSSWCRAWTMLVCTSKPCSRARSISFLLRFRPLISLMLFSAPRRMCRGEGRLPEQGGRVLESHRARSQEYRLARSRRLPNSAWRCGLWCPTVRKESYPTSHPSKAESSTQSGSQRGPASHLQGPRSTCDQGGKTPRSAQRLRRLRLHLNLRNISADLLYDNRLDEASRGDMHLLWQGLARLGLKELQGCVQKISKQSQEVV